MEYVLIKNILEIIKFRSVASVCEHFLNTFAMFWTFELSQCALPMHGPLLVHLLAFSHMLCEHYFLPSEFPMKTIGDQSSFKGWIATSGAELTSKSSILVFVKEDVENKRKEASVLV